MQSLELLQLGSGSVFGVLDLPGTETGELLSRLVFGPYLRLPWNTLKFARLDSRLSKSLLRHL